MQTGKNLIKNGGFDTNLNFWTISGKREMNDGQVYSDVWPYNNYVIELDADKNVDYSQTIELESEEFVKI